MNYRLLTEKQQYALAEILNTMRPCLTEGEHFKEHGAAQVLLKNLPALPDWIALDIVEHLLWDNKSGIASVMQDYAKMGAAA